MIVTGTGLNTSIFNSQSACCGTNEDATLGLICVERLNAPNNDQPLLLILSV